MKSKISVVVSVLVVAAVATIVASRAASAGPQKCPNIVAPVICDNGVVYVNSCYASLAHAKNCVPYDR